MKSLHSAQNFLKSKYMDKDKQKTVPMLNRRQKGSRLIDLCPEQKLKVGELIKSLEARKQQNEGLIKEIAQIKQKYQESQQELIHLSQNLQAKLDEIQQLTCKLQQIQQKYQVQCKLNNRLTLETQLLKQASKLKNSIYKQSKTIQTEARSTSHVHIQTKKCKTKNQYIQVEAQNQQKTRRGIFYYQHTKSFQKIMKGQSIQLDKNRLSQYNDHLTEKYSAFKLSDQLIVSSSPNKKSDSQQISERNDSLNKKWQELKNKNMKQNNISKQFKHKYYQSNQSCSSPQQLIQGHRNHHTKKESSMDSLDQVELNKLLKTKNFSASKLINSRAMMQGQILVHCPKLQRQINQIKKPYFETEPNIMHGNLSVPKSKQNKKFLTSSPNGINFYESDLLQLADSIKT